MWDVGCGMWRKAISNVRFFTFSTNKIYRRMIGVRDSVSVVWLCACKCGAIELCGVFEAMAGQSVEKSGNAGIWPKAKLSRPTPFQRSAANTEIYQKTLDGNLFLNIVLTSAASSASSRLLLRLLGLQTYSLDIYIYIIFSKTHKLYRDHQIALPPCDEKLTFDEKKRICTTPNPPYRKISPPPPLSPRRLCEQNASAQSQFFARNALCAYKAKCIPKMLGQQMNIVDAPPKRCSTINPHTRHTPSADADAPLPAKVIHLLFNLCLCIWRGETPKQCKTCGGEQCVDFERGRGESRSH